MESTAIERHFTARELADLWALNHNTIRKLFEDEPGVLRIPGTQWRGKRGYVSIRIPQSVAERVHRKRAGL